MKKFDIRLKIGILFPLNYRYRIMNFEKNKEFYNRPIRLIDEWKNDPFLCIEDFCGTHALYEIRQTFADWFEAALIANQTDYNAIKNLYCLQIFYNDLESLIEAIYLINKRKGNINLTETN